MPPAPQAYRPEARLLTLGDAFFDPVEPADFPQTTLRFRNDRAAAEVGLDTLSDDEWRAHFGRFAALPGTLPQPLALRYHGHQFRTYNPEIGDGRGFTFAQLRGGDGRLFDLGTKGSGRTPHSRFGDGRLTLKGGVREILATEMLEALGVETSRTLSLIETGEALERGDEPSPTRSAVLVRLSHGHIRIGTFQRLAYFRDTDAMRRLVDYCLTDLFGVAPEADDAPAQLLRLTVERTARLAASYMAAGFVHGVLNSDNINVTGESFDYGPWRFAPTWDAGFTAAYFDHQGLYAFGRQPEAIYWDCGQLAISLRQIAKPEPLVAALETFGDHYRVALGDRMTRRLGLVRDGEHEAALVQAIGLTLAETGVPIDRFFFDAFGGALPSDYGAAWEPVRALLSGFAPTPAGRSHPYFADDAPCTMLIEDVEAIWAAIDRDDDWSPLHAKVAEIRRMGAALDAGRVATGGH